MNIGTMGAAVTIMNTNSRMMMRGGGGSGSNKDDKPKRKIPFFWSLLLNIFLALNWMFAPYIAMMDSDVWNYDRPYTVEEKKVFNKVDSKQNPYDVCYVKAHYHDTNKSEWIQVRDGADYLNTKVGDVKIDRAQKDGAPYYWRRIIGIGFTLISLIIWSIRTAPLIFPI
jgi:hypothetical protein